MTRRTLVWRINRLLPLAMLLAGCDQLPGSPLQPIPTFQISGARTEATAEPTVVGPARRHEAVAAGAIPPVPTAPVTNTAIAAASPTISLNATKETLSLEQVSLPQFINEVFSKAFGLTVQIDQRVMTRSDIVTLRTGTPLASAELFRMAEHVLAGYGVGVSWDGSVLHIAPEDTLIAQMPDLIRSRALPEMPIALRPIFQIIELHQVSTADMSAWLTNAYGAKIKVFPAGKIAAVMVFGLPENVRAAVEAVNILDQARLAGRPSLRIGLVYWTAQALAAKLTDVLRAEGYDVSIAASAQPNQISTVMLIPVETSNSLIAFAADAKLLDHIRRWTADLDQASQADPLRSIFIYLVQNTTAESLGQIVQAALGGQQRIGPTTEAPLERFGQTRAGIGGDARGGAGPLMAATPAPAPLPAPAPAIGPVAPVPGAGETAATVTGQTLELGQPAGSSGPPARLVIDQARNALVFIGTAQDYQRIRPLLETLDRSPREALIEVTVAELTLNDNNNLGLDWTQLNHIGGRTQVLGTGSNVRPGGSGGIPIGTSGFNYVLLNSAGDVRIILNAFSANNRVSVLSTPRVLAQSGSAARIDVGTEVPIVTSQGTTNTIQNAGTTGILQSIDYRKTGVLLSVRPVIHSSNRIELAISQEVSEALPNTTPGISTPLIQNRNLSTNLTLTDGQTVMIGGMIAENRTSDDTGVPYLKDVPGLGLLFRNQSRSRERTELLVFITPYVISGDVDSATITEQFRAQMNRWPVPSTTLHW